jgi:hypothetical protein
LEDINTSNKLIGKRIIESALSLDEALTDILKKEAKVLKAGTKDGTNPEELLKIISLIRNIIMALTLTDYRLKTGIDLYLGNKENNDI